MAMVNLQHVTYRYPMTEQPALEDLSLQIEEGEFVAVIGPNGAGKSTLCYTVAGFIPHFFKGELEGTVEVAGVESRQTSLEQRVRSVGLVFQNPFSQISGAKYTVFEEIAFGLENLGVSRAEMPARVERAMALAGITDLAERSPYALSGGQQQRVALASILVMEPKVLVLDEPTSQLDPVGTREVFGAIRSMALKGMTVLMVEHKLEWVAAFADRVVALENGRILAEGPPAAVLTDERLLKRHFGFSRYTLAAREGREDALWPPARRLPVTLDEAEAGFREGLGWS